jgi:hypothetical protein
MQQFAIDAHDHLSRNSADEAPAEARPAARPAPALVFTPLAPKGRAPGLVVQSHLKAGAVGTAKGSLAY